MNDDAHDCRLETSPSSDKSVQARLSSPREVKLLNKIKALQSQRRRLRFKISKMEDVTAVLKKKCLGNSELFEMLDNTFQGLPILPILKNQVENIKKDKNRRRYSADVKEFALTLYFYSPKSYQFLRQYLYLPHKSIISKWISSINGDPGLLSDVFKYLQDNSHKEYLKEVALIFDSMSIRKQIVYDKKNGFNIGNVNLGGLPTCDRLAKEALFFQVVSFSIPFKAPVAYFLVDSINSDLQAQILMTVIEKLHEVNVKVRSVTCDGPQANIQTLKNVGCDLQDKPQFPHPVTGEPIYVFLDPCHMIKLARNALADCKVMISGGREIKWAFIENLYSVQESEGFKFANKLNLQHIVFKNKIMNVALAAQTLSSSVADAIDYLRKIGHPAFQGSEETVKFIRTIDRTFDLLNSRNPYGKGYKQPIRPESLNYYEGLVLELSKYISSLSIDGTPILNHRRKTFAVGFMACLKSLLPLSSSLFTCGLKYFLSYKISQDHIELLFNCIRNLGGHNDNPNCFQLKTAVQKIQLRSYISPSLEGNCRQFENENMGFLSVPVTSHQGSQQEANFEEELLSMALQQPQRHSSLTANILFYITGYIVRKLLPKLHCTHCRDLIDGGQKLAEAHNDHNYCFVDGR